MALTPCHQLAKDLKAAIDARMLGKKAQSVGHKGRNVAFTETSTKDLIAYYNQVRSGCPDACEDLDLLHISPLDGPTGTRGRPAVFHGRGHV